MILLFFNLELKHIFQVHLLSNERIFLFYLVVLNWIIDRYYTLKIMIIWGGWKWRRTTQSDINFGLILLSCESVAVITSLETSLSQINCICHLIITSKHPPLTLMGILLSSEVNYFQLVNIFHCVPVFFCCSAFEKAFKICQNAPYTDSDLNPKFLSQDEWHVWPPSLSVKTKLSLLMAARKYFPCQLTFVCWPRQVILIRHLRSLGELLFCLFLNALKR